MIALFPILQASQRDPLQADIVKLGRFSALTLGVTVLDRVDIGENTVVGAGSLVATSLPSNVLAYGNPARIIRERKAGEKFCAD